MKGQQSFQVIDSSCSSKANNKVNAKKQRSTKAFGRELKWKDDTKEDSEASDNLSAGQDQVPCISCGRLYGDKVRKYKPHWVSCDVGTVWTCVEFLPSNLDVAQENICQECLPFELIMPLGIIAISDVQNFRNTCMIGNWVFYKCSHNLFLLVWGIFSIVGL